MADYLPKFTAGKAFTRAASAVIVGGQLVGVSGSGTVAPTTASQASWLGVAAFDVASGDQVTVYTGGVQRLTASGAVTAGDLVVAAASGQVATVAAVTTPTAADVTTSRAIVGVALTTATTGTLVEVSLLR